MSGLSEEEAADLVDQIADLVAEFGAETAEWPTLSERVRNELAAREELAG